MGREQGTKERERGEKKTRGKKKKLDFCVCWVGVCNEVKDSPLLSTHEDGKTLRQIIERKTNREGYRWK